MLLHHRNSVSGSDPQESGMRVTRPGKPIELMAGIPSSEGLLKLRSEKYQVQAESNEYCNIGDI